MAMANGKSIFAMGLIMGMGELGGVAGGIPPHWG